MWLKNIAALHVERMLKRDRFRTPFVIRDVGIGLTDLRFPLREKGLPFLPSAVACGTGEFLPERIEEIGLRPRVRLSGKFSRNQPFRVIGRQSFEAVERRIQAACESLQREGSQINEVARDLGVCDQSAFTQLFQKYAELTPLKYQDLTACAASGEILTIRDGLGRS